MSGTFAGVGVGPGNPELMTLKAVRAIRECSVIAVPVSDNSLQAPVCEKAGTESQYKEYLNRCVAFGIARGAVPEVEKKDRIFLPMPMIKEKDKLRNIHNMDADAVAEILEQGRDVVFLTLGDPTVYSTCMYVHKRLKRKGYPTELVPGIPSFCAAAARMDTSLAENRQELHILPASYQIERELELPGTKVLMKAGRKMTDVKRILMEKELDVEMVENCGMENEKVYLSAEEIPEQAGYYSLLIVKEKSTGGEKR